jgi:hypothetical protein
MKTVTTFLGPEPKLIVNPQAERILDVIERQLDILERLADELHWLVAEGTRVQTHEGI